MDEEDIPDMLICSCGSNAYKDELSYCRSCEDSVCPRCATVIQGTVNKTVPTPIERLIMDDLFNKDKVKCIPQGDYHIPLCVTCFSKYEVQFILSIPVHDLPLYINHPWDSELAKRSFRARLAGESTIEPKEAAHGS